MPAGAGIFSGRTNYFSFGLTTLMSDCSDLLTVQEKEGKYLHDGQYHTFQNVIEIIKIKGENDYNLTVEITNNGPVLNPGVIPLLEQKVSFRWTGNMNNETTLEGIYALLKSKTVEDIENALY